jgi:acyl carrier protein
MVNRQEILETLSEAMEINGVNLTEETALEELGSAWDSVCRLSVISMIDSYAHRAIPVNAIVESKTVKDLIDLICISENQIIDYETMIKENNVLNTIREEVVKIIKKAFKEVADNSNINLPANIDDESRILGGDSPFDSIHIINMIFLIEENIIDTFDLDITLANDHTMCKEESPFISISKLTDYIVGHFH